MATPLQQISESMLTPNNLALDDLPSLVSELSVGRVDFADLFFERVVSYQY